jgi:tetratricopeptide (TPR) repeat protein
MGAREDPLQAAVERAESLLRRALVSPDPGLHVATVESWRWIANVVPADHPERPAVLYNLGMSLRIRSASTGGADDLDQAVAYLRTAVTTAPDDHRARAKFLFSLGSALYDRFELTSTAADLAEGTDRLRDAVAATAPDDPERARYLDILGNMLLSRFQWTGTMSDLDEVADCYREAIALTPAGHPDRSGRLSNLGVMLRTKAERTGDLDDLNDAIIAAREPLTAAETGHPERAKHLSNLGNTLLTRFKRTGTMSDLTEAIELFREAADAAPSGSGDLAAYQNNLGIALRERFARTGALDDVNDAITAGREAVAATPAGHPDRPRRLSNLAVALLDRFVRTDALGDLDEAVTGNRAAVTAIPAGHRTRARLLSNLGISLQTRFARTGAQPDVDEAVECLLEAVAAGPDDHLERAERLSNLGNALESRFERTGQRTDLDQAITAGRAAAAAWPAGHPRQAANLSNLGMTLRVRFERTGSERDLDESIAVGREAVAAAPADVPDRTRFLSNLGWALRARFDRLGSRRDLDEAISVGREAVAAAPADHPERAGLLSNLSVELQDRFSRAGSQADLDEAVAAAREAVAAAPDGHPGRAIYLSGLRNAFHARFGLDGVPADLDRAIECMREAAGITPASQPNRVGLLANLGMLMYERFQQGGARADLDEAVAAAREAVAAASADDPGRANAFISLGRALRARSDLDEAADAMETAAGIESAAPTIRIYAGHEAATWSAGSDPARAARLLDQAVRLLPRVAPRQLERGDQQVALGSFAGLAASAAALALRDPRTPERDRAARALGLLETGRAVLLSQVLETRSDISELAVRQPALAARFSQLHDMLDNVQDNPALIPGSPRDHRQFATEFDDLLAQIRALDGFGSFLLPPSAAELTGQAAHGPVVTFNVSVYGSDALLLTAEGIASVPLPGLDVKSVADRVTDFRTSLDIVQSAHASTRQLAVAERQLSSVLEWLWDTAAGPVLDALGFDSPPPPGGDWPRVWWVPGGLLGLLPVHAAGYHGAGARAVMDRVVSSYSPTIRALGYARGPITGGPASDDGAEQRALIVAMATTPGTGAPLVFAAEEARRISARLPGAVQLTGPGDAAGTGELPTRDSVLRYLPACAIAHFACHGISDPADPSRSRLLLHDHDTAPLTVEVLGRLHLSRRPGQARLAYLSACNTALTSVSSLVDEAIHLASAFQLAGYSHVIGTLWEINDDIAAEVADDFYASLIGDGARADIERSARALHQAVQRIRAACPGDPSLWAAYLHTSA